MIDLMWIIVVELALILIAIAFPRVIRAVILVALIGGIAAIALPQLGINLKAPS